LIAGVIRQEDSRLADDQAKHNTHTIVKKEPSQVPDRSSSAFPNGNAGFLIVSLERQLPKHLAALFDF
jgi:hypothetical protein